MSEAAARVLDAAHHLQRRGRHEEVAHLVIGDNPESRFGIEFGHAVTEHRHAVVQARQQDVQQPADPGPVGRRPKAVAGRREELLRQLDAGQVAQQDPVAMQRALGRPRRAGGVNDDRRIVGAGIGRRKGVAGLVEFRVEVERAPARFPARALDAENQLQLRQALAQQRDLGESGPVGHQRLGPAVAQAILKRLFPEQREERHGDAAKLVNAEMADGRFRRLGQQNADPVAARHAVSL